MSQFVSQREYPNWLQAYAQYTEMTEAPAHFHLWTGLWAISSILARKVWIDMGNFDWIPNQYIVLVGSPGVVTKSTSIRLAEELVRLTETVRFGSNSSTWQALVREMTEANAANMEGQVSASLSLAVSELGAFLDLENREQVDFMVDIWDGQRGIWKRRTVGGGELTIDHPCLNMIAATTPNWIRENFKQQHVGGGLSSRMLLILGKAKRHLIAYPGIDGIGLLRDMKPKLVDDLKRISELEGPMHLTPEALIWGRDWYHSHITRPEARQLAGERFDHYYARKQTHLHKIAMILSAATSDRLLITKRHLQAANGILLDMEKGYSEILAHVQAGSIYSASKLDLLRIIAEHPNGIEKRQLYKEVQAFLSGFDFERCLADLIKGESIREVVGGSSPKYRLPRDDKKGDRPQGVQDDRSGLEDMSE